MSAVPVRPRRSDGIAAALVLRIALAVLVLVVVFGFLLPRTADYGDAWATVQRMTAVELVVILVAGLWNLFTYWPMMILALPGLRMREAVVVNQASTAIANTVPAGGAFALGVTYRMLRSWGFTSPAIASEVLATGVWNMLVKFGLPVVALAALTATGELEGDFVKLTLVGLGILAAVVVLGGLALRAEASTRRVGRGLDRAITRRLARVWRRPVDVESWLVRMRTQMLDLVHTTGYRITIAAVVSHLSLFLVLLVTLRNVGVSEAEVSWARILAAFAFVRLLSVIPITPGGVGVVELGYVGFLSAGTGDGLDSQVAGAVLVFRAVTFLLPIGLGGIAWLVFRAAPSWHEPSDTRGGIYDVVAAHSR